MSEATPTPPAPETVTFSNNGAADAGAYGKMQIITVSREYGSGGGEIAARLAQRLNWRLVDHEVVVEVARRLGVTIGDAARRDEQAESVVDQVLRSFRTIDPTPLAVLDTNHGLTAPEARDYARALRETVLATAYAGKVIIVGRGGQAILHERRDTLHVRFVAPLPMRVAYVAGREGLDRVSAQRRVQKKDTDRERYLRMTHDIRAEDPALYDIVLNTGILDLDSCVDLVMMALERKEKRIKTPDELLGPGAGLSAYAGSPEDLPPLPEKAAPAKSSSVTKS